MYADAAESEKTGKIPADGSREDPAQGFLIFSEFADAGELYFGAPARKSLKTLDFSREGSVGVQGATRFKPCNSGHLLRYLRSVYVQYTSFICLANDRNFYG